MEEKDIKGFEGIYKINSNGIITALARTIVRDNYSGTSSNYEVKETIKRPDIDAYGYYKVVLSKKGIKTTCKLHILLAETFIPNPNNYPIVRHLNDIKTDNRLENLAWGTSSDNAFDAIKNGKRGKGETHNMSKLTKDQVSDIRTLLSEKKITHQAIADKFKVSRTVVTRIKNNILWKQ